MLQSRRASPATQVLRVRAEEWGLPCPALRKPLTARKSRSRTAPRKTMPRRKPNPTNRLLFFASLFRAEPSDTPCTTIRRRGKDKVTRGFAVEELRPRIAGMQKEQAGGASPSLR